VSLHAAFSTKIYNLFSDNNINLGKLPASCSGILQPSDVSPLFKNVKSKVTSFINNNTIPQNQVLSKNISNSIKKCESKHKLTLSNDYVDKICQGCVTVVKAIQDTINPSKISNGFRATGQYPLDYYKLMSQCYKKVSHNDLQELLKNEDEHIAIFRETGMVPGEDLNQGDIPTNSDKERDHLPIQNQRAVLITHEATRERHINRMNNGISIGTAIVDAVNRQERDEIATAAKIVRREQNRLTNLEEKRNRRALLTSEEKLAEKAANKKRLQDKKDKKKAELDSAAALLAKYHH
jgi:hypothetical protein